MATNSLLLNAVVVARAYGELDQNKKLFPDSLNQVTLSEIKVSEWLQSADDFVKEVVKRGNIIIIYSPFLRAIAADLESKLAESALLHCQVADMRSFAHGRHLWLANRAADCAILALTDPSMPDLWPYMKSILPSEVPTFTMHTRESAPLDLIVGLVAQMHLVAKIAKELNIDPAKPVVPQFGRDLYYTDIQKLVPVPNNLDDLEHSKYAVLGARWPSTLRQGFMRRKLEAYKMALERQEFKVIVFDYDGTLCSSQRKDVPPTESVRKELIRLAEAGIIIGIASGRGGSIRENLSILLPQTLWSRFRLGLYNCGLISNIDISQQEGGETSEFLSHAMRIVGNLKAFGVPIYDIRLTQPYQVSVRFQEGINTESMWFVLADALRTAGLDFSKMMLSKHSIDILAGNVSKSRLIAEIIQEFKVKPHQILTMGDQGAWPGNDSTLLEHRYSLSVDVPSRRIDRGWNLAPPHKRDVDATLWYLERLSITDKESFYLHLDYEREEIGLRL
ncbi:MAG: HAD family phosphatase [Nitrospirae bacterium]|nr:HAD family phosphatase [Nitrospirota bacterium]